MSQETPASQTEARIKTKRRISPFWLLPVIALLIAAWLSGDIDRVQLSGAQSADIAALSLIFPSVILRECPIGI